MLLAWSSFSAENDQATSGFYAKPVAIGDFQKHCIQRRKYPVLLKLEFNNAVKEREIQPCRASNRKNNIEKNQTLKKGLRAPYRSWSRDESIY